MTLLCKVFHCVECPVWKVWNLTTVCVLWVATGTWQILLLLLMLLPLWAVCCRIHLPRHRVLDAMCKNKISSMRHVPVVATTGTWQRNSLVVVATSADLNCYVCYSELSNTWEESPLRTIKKNPSNSRHVPVVTTTGTWQIYSLFVVIPATLSCLLQYQPPWYDLRGSLGITKTIIYLRTLYRKSGEIQRHLEKTTQKQKTINVCHIYACGCDINIHNAFGGSRERIFCWDERTNLSRVFSY